MSYANVDASALYPAESGTPRVGSFMSGTPEAVFVEMFWRVKIWRLRVTADLIWNDGTDDIVVWPAGTVLQLEAGSNDTEMTGAYADLDDLLCNFRTSRLEEGNISASNGAPQYARLAFGGPLFYTLDRTVDDLPVDGEGLFDSWVMFQGSNGDISGYLGTEYNVGVASGNLTEATGLQIVVKLHGEEVANGALYMDDIPDLPDRFWSCAGEIILEPAEADAFWEWEIDGVPTWDADDGEELNDPLRLSEAGFQRIFLAQPPEPV